MEQPILSLVRMAFLSLRKDPGGILPSRIAWFLLPWHYSLGKMRELALQPAKAWTHPDKLRSRSPPLLSHQQRKGPTGFAARSHIVCTSPNPS